MRIAPCAESKNKQNGKQQQQNEEENEGGEKKKEREREGDNGRSFSQYQLIIACVSIGYQIHLS